MLYITCTMISSVDHAYYGVSHAKDWISVDCGTNCTGDNYYRLHIYRISSVIRWSFSVQNYPKNLDPPLGWI